MAVDPRNFLLNTDYEMDKIVYFTDGSISAGQTKTISHNLGFMPLVFGVCAFSSSFSDSRALPYQELPSIVFDVSSDGSSIYLTYSNQNESPGDMYYRIYAFEPSDSSADVPYTSGHANNFILNTDYNYCKLFQKGIINGASGSVMHNLGYIPQILAWYERSDNKTVPVEYLNPVSNLGGASNVTITNNSVSFDIFQAQKIHYRIYYDQAG